MAFIITSPAEIIKTVSSKAVELRIDVGLTQRELATKAGVSYSSLRVFENTGKASFELVVKVAYALGAEDEFGALFKARPIKSLDDLAENKRRLRVRK